MSEREDYEAAVADAAQRIEIASKKYDEAKLEKGVKTSVLMRAQTALSKARSAEHAAKLEYQARKAELLQLKRMWKAVPNLRPWKSPAWQKLSDFMASLRPH